METLPAVPKRRPQQKAEKHRQQTGRTLTRTRLFAILPALNPPIHIRLRGNVQTGIFFHIHGKRARDQRQSPRRIAGIIVSDQGFRSEVMRPGAAEQASGIGQRRFLQRVNGRKAMLKRWVGEFLSLARNTPHSD